MGDMRLENLNRIDDIALWGCKGLRIMIGNFLNSLDDDIPIDDLYVAINDMYIKAQDVERNLYRCIEAIGFCLCCAERLESA